ncbi:MAG: hypothetical protein AAF657_24060, partial [Acidobacteriota bacterium]
AKPGWRLWRRDLREDLLRLLGPGELRLKAAAALVLIAALSPLLYFRVLRYESVMAPADGLTTPREEQDSLSVGQVRFKPPEKVEGSEPTAQELPISEEQLEQLEALGYLADTAEANAPTIKSAGLEQPAARRWDAGDPVEVVTKSGSQSFSGAVGGRLPAGKRVKKVPIPDPTPDEPEPIRLDEALGDAPNPPAPPPPPFVGEFVGGVVEKLTESETIPTWVGTEADITFRGGSPRVESEVAAPFGGDDEARQRVRERLRERLRNLPRGQQAQNEKLDQENAQGTLAPEASERHGDYFSVGSYIGDDTVRLTDKAGAGGPASRNDPTASNDNSAPSDGVLLADSATLAARAFLDQRERLDGLRFQSAEGYWSNTYVPGDPLVRYLQARLAGLDRTAFETASQQPVQLHDASQQTTQPFDPPADAALGVYLHADRKTVVGASRMLVQVGLAATERYGGRRPPMQIAVVLDLSAAVAPEDSASLRALLAALGEARDLGDRFHLLVAGPAGGELLGPQDFRHGPLTVAMRQLFADGGEPPSRGQELSVLEAVRLAFERVGQGDDPTAPLGSSAVLLLTTRPLGAEVEALAEMAHQGAVAGIPSSVVGVGDAIDPNELERLALAGQGSRHLLRQPTKARALIDRELSAVARVVARAVRLRIGLAPGVRLVNVIGARRFDATDAEKVRQAERSIDQRLARNLGIEADRGDDEPGIQIVIPTFYSGDRHVVLLDVVAPGPGPIADLTVRFKDLVHPGNGVAQAQLTLPRGESAPGPLERNVLKNLLAHQLRQVLESAGREVAAGQLDLAVERLRAHHSLLAGLRSELHGLDQDRDLGRDVAMLDEYLHLLGSPALGQPAQIQHLAQSLRYAARLKVLPAPVPMGGAR